MKLREINLSESMLQDKAQVEAWLVSKYISDFTIHPNLTVDIDGSVYIDKDKIDVLPVKFGVVSKSFILSGSELTSLRGCPTFVGETFNISRNMLTSFEGAPSNIDGAVYAHGNNFESLVGISKIIKKVNGVFSIDFNKIKEGGLELLLIPGLKLGIAALAPAAPFKIINKYMGTGDIFECQTELIENGFEEFAKM